MDEWKKGFAARVRFGELCSIGAFRMVNQPPEPLGKGKYRIILECKDGSRRLLTTYESTIGDIIINGGADGSFVQAVKEGEYTRIQTVKETKVKEK
jgi:hypothetical protein